MRLLTITATVAAALSASGVNAQAADEGLINSAMAAAPSTVSAKATVIAPQADGSMKVLRKGTNNWTCMPDNPATPGPDAMCLDPNAMRWAQAWMTHAEAPPADNVGLGYMLAGGTDPTNTDPFAPKPAAGDDWIRTGPHLMVFGAESVLKNYPSEAKPDTTVPYVMWGGTPYAHMMIPIGEPTR